MVVTKEDGAATFAVANAFGDFVFMLFGKKFAVLPPNLLLILLDGTNDDTEYYFLLSFHLQHIAGLDTVFYRTVSSTHVNIVALLRGCAYAARIR